MPNSSPATPNGVSSLRLTRSLSALETWGFGLSGLLLWLGTEPGMHVELGPQAIWVWLPGVIIGVMLNLQVKHLGTQWPDVSGGTPNYTTRLLKNHPGLARYVAIGYWLGWVSVPSMNAIILTNLIQANVEPMGIACPEVLLKVGFTALPFIVAFSGTRALSILHLFFVLPAIGFLFIFCTQGLGWLAISPESPGLLPTDWSRFQLQDWAKWFFVAVYAVYGCETASSFVADSRRPAATLQSLSFAALLLPVVYLGGSWLLMRLATAPELEDNAFLELEAAARPFWGNAASILVTFLIASGCLLSSATAVSNAPRILYQLSLDGYLSPLFGVVSRRGVLGPSLAFTGLLSLACLLWGDVARVVMVTGTSYLMSMIGIHLGMWLRRKYPESRWAGWSLGFCLMEVGVLVVGGLAWGWQDLLIGLLLPIAVLGIDAAVRRSTFPLLRASWWIQRYQQPTLHQFSDLMLRQVCVLIVLVCSATGVGWFGRARLDGVALDNNANLFVVLLLGIAFVGVAIACWTTLPQVASVMEAREQAEQLFLIARDAILVLDEQGKIHQVNPAAKALFAIEGSGLRGRSLHEFFLELSGSPETWLPQSEQTLNFPSGEQRIVEIAVSKANRPDLVAEYVIILRDVTERKQAEEALRRSEARLRQQAEDLEAALQYIKKTQSKLVQNEKMSSLGQLVAGVAHEINNPVNFIYGNLSHANNYAQDLLRLLKRYQEHYPNPDPELQAEAEEIDLEFLVEDMPRLLASMKVGADRIKSIVSSLRNFSRMDESEVKAVNIHEGIDSTLMILQNRLKAKPDHPEIQIIKEYGDLPLVECYAGQINQVFMNILTNAIDAIEEVIADRQWGATQGGYCELPTITIRTQAIDTDWVKIKIADNGPGIPTEVQKQLFEPFFTTKPIGKGTGLGLSISYDIITEKHGGELQCFSSPGNGTEFVIEIPVFLAKKRISSGSHCG